MESIQQIFAVLAVLGLLAGTLFWLRRRGMAHVPVLSRRRGNSVLQAADRLQLSPTHALHLVRMADRAILLAISPSGCQVVETSSWAQIEGRLRETPQ